MSTLKLENIKHENSSTNNMVMDSDGSVSTTGNATVGGTLGVTGATTVAGDLTVDTSTLKADATNNRVGIGTATPSKVLDITQSTSDDNANVKLTYAGGDGNRSGFILNNTHTGGREYGIYAGNNSTGGGLGNSLGISDNTAGTAYRLLISSEGAVTKASQPYFDAYISTNQNTSSGVQNMSTTASWGAHVNTGSHFNTSNGTFTAPIAGRYLFYAGLGVQGYPTSAYISCEFEVNGARKYIHWFSNYGTSYAAANNTAVINLNASDYVRLVSETHQSATYIGTASGIYSHFGGYLLG